MGWIFCCCKQYPDEYCLDDSLLLNKTQKKDTKTCQTISTRGFLCQKVMRVMLCSIQLLRRCAFVYRNVIHSSAKQLLRLRFSVGKKSPKIFSINKSTCLRGYTPCRRVFLSPPAALSHFACRLKSMKSHILPRFFKV